MISKERRKILEPFIEYLQSKIDLKETINLNFICTHNSRRSHLAQIWAQIAAEQNGIDTVYCYSGGTEATAVFPVIAQTLENQGLQVAKLSESDNPIYFIKSDKSSRPMVVFSKMYNHPFNPSDCFAAIMTCSDADENCPYIPGAEIRIKLTYSDPKSSDGTDQQARVYLERSEEIKSDMFYIFNKLKYEVSS